MRFTNVSIKALLVCLIGIASAQTPPNPVFWERSFTMNMTTSTSKNVGTINQSTSYLVTSQDFQGIHVDPKTKYPPDRIVFNFGESCRSSNTTFELLQSLNNNGVDVPSIRDAQKVALVKRGNCNWSEKISVVNSLSNYINVSAVFIYDNDTHGVNISLQSTPAVGSGSIGPPSFSTPLPADRNILNMTDNDLNMLTPSTTVVYFLPFKYGDQFVQRINAAYDPTNNPTIRQYWLLTPYLEEVSWGYAGGDNFFSTGRGYLSYIIALAAIFLIGIIFLRWWRIRRMRSEYPNGFNGFTMANGFNMQPRVNQVDPLPVDIVNALPIDKYSEDLIKNVNCAICLEDFVSGKNDIRILPCGHGFCVLCIDPWLTQKSTKCPICKWDCLPVDLRRERDEQLRQQQQQQQFVGNINSNNDNINPDSVAINMSAPGPSTPSPSTVQQPVNNTAENTTGINGVIVPPTLLPSSFPLPSPPHMNRELNHNEKPSSSPPLENPFEPTSNDESSISQTPTQQSAESSRPLATNTTDYAQVDMSSSEKKPSSKD